MTASSADVLELLSFGVAEQSFCIPIACVREIRGWTKATPVPHAPDFILGVINLRGNIMPMVDLQRLLGLGPANISARSVIIIVDHGGATSGLVVDAVQDTMVVERSTLQLLPILVDIDNSLAEAVLPHGDGLVTVLAPERLTAVCQAHAK